MEEDKKNNGVRLGMGWLPDYPDLRDYTVDKDKVSLRLQRLNQKDSVKAMISKLGIAQPDAVSIPNKFDDLKQWCSPVEDQGYIGSCTAQAGVGLMEYYERRAFGTYIDASRLFLYKVTRNLLRLSGDTGASCRSTMAAMTLFGVPPEKYWPYTDSVPDFDREPSSFCYAFAQNYQVLQYFRLDPPGTPGDLLLKRIKAYCVAGLPSMFGFSVFDSYTQAQDDGKIPYPCSNDSLISGHAVVAVGYDDKVEIVNTNCGLKTVGALLIRNSWGTGWGDHGYGWLPYCYVWTGLAIDWWSLLKNEWVDTGVFGLKS